MKYLLTSIVSLGDRIPIVGSFDTYKLGGSYSWVGYNISGERLPEKNENIYP